MADAEYRSVRLCWRLGRSSYQTRTSLSPVHDRRVSWQRRAALSGHPSVEKVDQPDPAGSSGRHVVLVERHPSRKQGRRNQPDPPRLGELDQPRTGQENLSRPPGLHGRRLVASLACRAALAAPPRIDGRPPKNPGFSRYPEKSTPEPAGSQRSVFGRAGSLSAHRFRLIHWFFPLRPVTEFSWLSRMRYFSEPPAGAQGRRSPKLVPRRVAGHSRKAGAPASQ